MRRQPVFPRSRGSACALALLAAMVVAARGQSTFQETFTGTSAYGWHFGGLGSSTAPYLTAGVVSGDAVGSGWLRLTNNTNNQATYALLDTEIFSVGAQIQISMEYAFWDDARPTQTRGADGITFFLVDGSVDAASFQPGSYGGSLGYAPLDTDGNGSVDSAGMAGAYLGFGFDNFGNYAGATEGRSGGLGTTYAGYANRVSVRGPDDGDGNNATGWEFIEASSPLQSLSGGGQMDFPNNTTRPGQTGVDYRSFRLTLDASNLLVVEMKFGASSDYIVVFESDLSSYARPDSFKIGFTGSTGGEMEIQEIRNVSVVSTPNATIGGSYEWDDGKYQIAPVDDDWGSTAGGEANANWFSLSALNNNKTPFADSDIFFGSRPVITSAGAAARPSPYASVQTVNLAQNVEVRSLNFNTKYDYQLGGPGTITLGDTGKAGTPSINVTDSIANPRFHRIDNALSVVENLAVANESHSALTLDGAVALGSNTLATSGAGYTNLNGVVTGSGPLVVNGAAPNGRDSTGIVTLKADNSSAYTGAITVNGGQLVALHNGALGDTSAGTTVTAGGTLTFRGGISTAEPLTLSGSGTSLSEAVNAAAVYNDGGDNTLSGSITLAANSSIHSRAGNLSITGSIGQSGGARSLTKTGEGVVTLGGSSASYTGSTIVTDGALRVADAAALAGGFSTDGGTGGNLALGGGVLEIATTAAFARQVGTGADQVSWTGDGGFSAYAGDRTVSLANPAGVAGGQLTWNAGGFVSTGSALLLSSEHSGSTITLANAIDLAGSSREVRVADGSASVDGVLSGNLTNGGLVKTGDGTLNLAGAGNTYSGATRIDAGSLRGNISTGSNIELNGGVLELSANYVSALGTGAGQLQWTGGGGLAALSGGVSLNVNGNGTSTTLTWGAGNFVASGQTLVLGSAGSAGTLSIANNLALGSSARTVRMQNGSADIDAQFDGDLSVSTGGSLRVEGAGTLAFSFNNAAFNQALTINGAEFRMVGSSDLGSMTSLSVSGGGTFKVDNGATNDTSRLSNSLPVSLNGGNLAYLGNTGSNSSETIGALSLAGGANAVQVARGGTQTATLTVASLSRSATATFDFSRPNTSSSLAFGTTSPTLDDGILAYGTVNGSDFAGLSGSTLVAYSGYDTGAQTAWTSTADNAAPAADQTLSAARTINSLKLADGIDVTQAGFTLTLQSGGLLSTGSTTGVTISGGTLTTGNTNELVVHAHNTSSAGTTLSSTITGSGGLTKSGSGALTLSGSANNTYTGATTVNAGRLDLAKTGGAVAIAGNLVVGDASGTDTVKLLGSEQIADTATVTLRGGTLLNDNHQAVLDLNGFTETFATLNVTGNSVVDFSGGAPDAPSFLVVDALGIATDAILTIRDWIDAADYFLVTKSGLDTTTEQDNISRVIFDGYGPAVWEDYSSDYYMITPHVRPVPEPATYGALALGGLLGFSLTRRRRRA